MPPASSPTTRSRWGHGAECNCFGSEPDRWPVFSPTPRHSCPGCAGSRCLTSPMRLCPDLVSAAVSTMLASTFTTASASDADTGPRVHFSVTDVVATAVVRAVVDPDELPRGTHLVVQGDYLDA